MFGITMKPMHFMALLAFVVAGCQATPEVKENREATLAAEGWVPLDAPALKSIFPGHTHSNVPGSEFNFDVYFSADGTMRADLNGNPDSGTYYITDDGLYCRTFQIFRSGTERCVKLYLKDTTLRTVLVSGDGGDDSRWIYAPGNPRAL